MTLATGICDSFGRSCGRAIEQSFEQFDATGKVLSDETFLHSMQTFLLAR